MQEEIIEAKKDPELVKQVIEIKEISNAEKIEILKKNKKKYKTIELKNLSEVFFMENGNKLDLYLNNKKIWNFDLVYAEYLRVEFIEWTTNDLYIEVGKDKFYYNLDTNTIISIKLNIDIQYVKKWLNESLIFVTVKWSFLYSIYNKSFEYFSYFNMIGKQGCLNISDEWCFE